MPKQAIIQEQDKMVPLDTSGDPVEVEIKDEREKDEVELEDQKEEVVEEKEEDQKEEVVAEEAEEEKKDVKVPDDPYETSDLDDYSKGVKKRINNLVGRMREMERAYTDVRKENDDLRKKYTTVGKGYVSQFEGRVNSAAEAAKSQLKKAIEDNDTDAQVKAQEALAQAKADGARLLTMKNVQQRDEATFQQQVQPQDQSQVQQQYQTPQIDTKAEEWASQNDWFGNDRMMTGAAMELHNQLINEEGFDPLSNEYYNEVNSRMRKEFPHKFTDGKVKEDKKSEKKQPVQTVASAVRKTKSGRRVVKLTPSQVAIAKRLNVPLEEYAKYVKEA
tara:strand:- start:784 stop:1779 length:996 start_codon:yes stop_codon:yes gene_type:complete